jgi:hypothetical protein
MSRTHAPRCANLLVTKRNTGCKQIAILNVDHQHLGIHQIRDSQSLGRTQPLSTHYTRHLVPIIHAISYPLYTPSRTHYTRHLVPIIHAISYPLYTPSRTHYTRHLVPIIHAISYPLYTPSRTHYTRHLVPIIHAISYPLYTPSLRR